jgi:hypothetical protein
VKVSADRSFEFVLMSTDPCSVVTWAASTMARRASFPLLPPMMAFRCTPAYHSPSMGMARGPLIWYTSFGALAGRSAVGKNSSFIRTWKSPFASVNVLRMTTCRESSVV